MPHSTTARLLVAATLFFSATAPSPADTPTVTVSGIRLAFDDGHHNAFTDLTVFNNTFFLACRSCPDGHGVSPNASVVILSSPDAKDWQEVHRFSVPERDTRDPHFLVFDNRLFVYTGTWFSGATPVTDHTQLDLNQHLGYAVTSRDGLSWSPPTMLEGTFGHYIWRAATHRGKAYLCGRRKIGFAVGPHGEPDEVESLMLESHDGFSWQKRATFQKLAGDETAFLFERDGSILAIGRRGRDHAQILRSRPPYKKWHRNSLGRYIGGPLLTRWGGRTVAGGRHSTSDGPKTSLCWLEGDQLTEFAELPSGGDNSYPGFIAISPTSALVSWYSSHKGDNASIYLADLSIAEDHSARPENERLIITAADLTLARQRTNGGWAKGNSDNNPLDLLFTRDGDDTTFDNGSTHHDLRNLAEAYTTTAIPRFRNGCLNAIAHLLESQYANGGWPQRYPKNHGYARHITFNDGAMIGVLDVLREITHGVKPFGWCDAPLRQRAATALQRGIDCILKCQIRANGTLTAWCQQHDENDLSPRPARKFEPACLCSNESAGIVRFLMQLENPSPGVVTAIEAAVTWLDGPAKLTGIRQITDDQNEKTIVADPTAPPLWSRFYEIGTDRPIFGDRDGKIYHDLSQISAERRNGYSWYTRSPSEMLSTAYPRWKASQP